MTKTDGEDAVISIYVHDCVSVSESLVAELIITRITTWKVKKDGLVVSVAEYRQLLGDIASTDEQIRERLQFLEAFCRNIIKPELQKHENTKH